MRRNRVRHEKLADYLTTLLEKGQKSFTKAAAINDLKLSEIAFLQSALRLIKKQILAKPISGFYIIITPEFRASGGPPPLWYIDDLMRFINQPYYVGLLSAAALHGATHQAVMELQTVTTRAIKPIIIGENRIKFIVNKYAKKIPKTEKKTPNGKVLVSTAGATAVDLVRFHKQSGGLSHVATALTEMSPNIRTKDLVKTAEIYQDAPLIQRAGYLLDKFAPNIRLKTLEEWLKSQRYDYKTLSSKREGLALDINKKWLIINDLELEPDDL